MIRRFLKRFCTPPLVVLAAGVMFFEEWLWNRVTALMARLGRLALFQWLEAKLTQLPPYGALSVMILPGSMLLPIKLWALKMITHGNAAGGISLILSAKVIGTAVVARMFSVCNAALMQIPWLKRLTDGVIRLKNWLYSRIKSMPGWSLAAGMKLRLSRWTATWRKDGLRRRWLAINRRLRRAASPTGDATPETVVDTSGDNSGPL